MFCVSRLKVLCALAASVLLIPATTNVLHAQEFQFAPAIDQTAMFEQMIQAQVELEINCMRMVAELSDDQSDAIREATSELVAEQAEKVAEAITRGDTSIASSMGNLSKSLKDAITKAAKEQLSSEAFKACNDDLAQRNSIQRKAAQRGYLVVLDDLLSLSTKQYSAIAKIVMKSWNDEWNAMGMVAGSTPSAIMVIKEPIKRLPEKELKSVLRESQWEALSGMMELKPEAFAFQPGPLAELQGKAINILRIEELQELCKLDDAQVEKFTQAGDTALKDIVKLKTEVMQGVQGGDPKAMQRMVEVMSKSVSSMLDKSPEWSEAVKTVLTKDQATLHAKRKAFRAKQNRNAFYAGTTMMFGQQAGGVTAAQMKQLAKLLPKHVKPTSVGMQLIMELVKIPEEPLKEILNEEQWTKIAAMREQMNQQANGVFQAFPAAEGDVVVEAVEAECDGDN